MTLFYEEDESMHNKIKWGFVGCGRVVEHKSGKAFNNVPNSCIYSILKRNLEKAREASQRFGAPNWFDNIDDLLKSDIDAVYIATPPGLHLEQAIKCCNASKPVYIEKPLARNYTESKEIVEAFSNRKIPIYVGHYHRALPRFKKIKQLLDSGCIGKVCAVDFYLNRIFSQEDADHTWLYNPILSGGGKFVDIAAHTIDIIIYLFGNIKNVNGFAINSGTGCPLEDNVAFTFCTENNIIGSAYFNLISNQKNDRMIVSGSEGTLEFSIHASDDIIVNNYNKHAQTFRISNPIIVEEPMIKTVVDDLLMRGCGECPCLGKDALQTYWVIDKILDDFYGGRSDDFWNHPERWS